MKALKVMTSKFADGGSWQTDFDPKGFDIEKVNLRLRGL